MGPPYSIFNHSTQGLPTDGSSVFVVSQCSTGCDNITLSGVISLNLTNIPKFILDINGTAYTAAETWEFAFLVCKPNAVIQTREIISNGTGLLEVLPVPNGKHYAHQDILHPIQTPIMLSFALNAISSDAGPTNYTTYYAGGGSKVQADFLFGQQETDSLPWITYSGPPISLTILPTEILAPKFGAMLQSASKCAQMQLDVKA